MPLCFGTDFPEYYYSIPEHERMRRVEATESLCVIDESHFFHRCQLIIPIHDNEDTLIWNVWLSISKENFLRRNDLWDDENRIHEAPYFGWLQTFIPTYGDTVNIKALAHERTAGMIPFVEILEEDHKLFSDQKNGISQEEAYAFVKEVLKSQHARNLP